MQKMSKIKKQQLKELCLTMLNSLGFDTIQNSITIISKGKDFLANNDSENFSKAVWEDIEKLETDSSFNEDDIGHVTNRIKKLFLSGNEKVVDYYFKKEELINKLTEDSLAYRKQNTKQFAEQITRILFAHIAEFTNINDFVKEYGDNIINAIENAKKEFQLSLLISQNEYHRNQIIDENGKYIKAYKKPLFLECNIGVSDDSKIPVSLEHIYIKPSNENKTEIEDRLSKWQYFGENLINISNVFLLYGNAGVGKSSLISWLIYNSFFSKACHAIALRNHVEDFDEVYKNKNSGRAWSAVKKCFNCDLDDKYQDKILVLDGLDEMCVLKPDFNAEIFLEELANSEYHKVKILITTRQGYFKENKVSGAIVTDVLKWESRQITDWCNKYKRMHLDDEKIQLWCSELPQRFNSFPENDRRREIFCVPIILYICCVSNIDISTHTSIVSIYDEAFKKIAHRAHNRDSALENSDEFNFEIQWTYTKELAYQMFLSGELGLSNQYVIAAQKRTQKIRNCSKDEIKSAAERYFAVFPFASRKSNSNGVEFAHKTVSDYFAAVKLYEDYFSKIDNKTATEIWENIYQAFRYKSVSEDIIKYIIDLIKKQNDVELWKNKFFNAYYEGMDDELLWKVMNYTKVDYYLHEELRLLDQVAVSYRNLTYLLTELGFDNKRFIENGASAFSSYLISNSKDSDINCANWQLKKYSLSSSFLMMAQLSKANLSSALLYSSNLSLSNLSFAILTNANLTNADLTNADLTNTDLTNADLSNANLTNADLSGADLSFANLSGSQLSGVTITGTNLFRANLCNVIISVNDLSKFEKALDNNDMLKFTPLIKDLDSNKFYDQQNHKIIDINNI